MKHILLTYQLIFLGLHMFAQDEVWMHPNAGQWDERIEFLVELNNGSMFIEKDGFTFALSDVKERITHSHEFGMHEDEHEEVFHYHTIKSKFQGSNWQGKIEFIDSSDFYRNYLLGNDPSKWKSKLYSYSKLQLLDVYEGISINLDGGDAGLKYSFKVEPGVDPSIIQIEYIGADRCEVSESGELEIHNRFGKIVESKPIGWIIKDGKREYVEVNFQLVGNVIGFEIPQKYDQEAELIIDPSLTFSTFTGSTSDNWGMSATPDQNGNLFGGSISFGPGYPITVGAYDASFNSGTIDLGITKFNDIGTALLYSTYLGGNGAETPNSIIASENTDELYIFGVTSSSNFPMAGASYDNSFNGGPSIPSSSTNNLPFTSGSDLYIARLSADGTSLIASTYIGGSNTDGINTSTLKYNYGDQFRGEIILDDQDNVYVASNSNSVDFPVTSGSLNGAQDAVVFKMNNGLSNLIWAEYIGGAQLETGNSLQLSSTGEVFVVGGTNSPTMPFNTGFDLTFAGGIGDGYVAKLNGANGSIISGSFIGYGTYDQAYFVQLDIDDEVYVLGQTQSGFNVSAGCYGNPNSGQFVRKFTNDLSSVSWTTLIGAGSGDVEISPTAFLVSDCYDIYISGWGGFVNYSYSQATNSSSNGFPVTADAYQPTTNGSNFYLAVLGQDASTLKYATYMGGLNGYYNHVDGGTSRFDKAGRVYHAVCGACGGQATGFTTTPGVWGPTNNSSNCNMAAFKFELNQIEAIVAVPDPIVCLPDPVIFNNSSINGNFFYWNFGDGDVSYDENTTHVYDGPGTYTVTLVVSDTAWCFSPDSATFEVYIGEFAGGVNLPSDSICPGEPYQFDAFGGQTYAWSPANYLDDPTVANPTAVVYETTTFQVIVSDSCGVDTIQVTLPVYINDMTISNDTSICIGNDIDLFVTGGISVEWTPATYLDDPFSFNPNCIPDQNIQYVVNVLTSNGCELRDSVQINVFYDPPIPVLPDQVGVCEGSSIEITCGGGEQYYWSPPIEIAPTSGPTVTVTPTVDRMYYVELINACGSAYDSVYVEIITPNITAGNDTIICPGESAQLWAQGGVSYYWSPMSSLNNPYISTVIATPSQPTTYEVVGIDEFGCSGSAFVNVDLFPMPNIWTNPDVYAFVNEEVMLSAYSSTSGPFTWWPSEYLSCVSCTHPTAMPNQNFTYYVSYTDENGCSATDSVNIYYEPFIYVPNTFTPDGDEFNNVFEAIVGNVQDVEMLIYNRWGELIFESNDPSIGWDGTYAGFKCQDGTYVWKLKVIDLNGIPSEYVGHVNLLR